jgi:hypothetical protein
MYSVIECDCAEPRHYIVDIMGDDKEFTTREQAQEYCDELNK